MTILWKVGYRLFLEVVSILWVVLIQQMVTVLRMRNVQMKVIILWMVAILEASFYSMCDFFGQIFLGSHRNSCAIKMVDHSLKSLYSIRKKG